MLLTALFLAAAAPVRLPPVEQCRDDRDFSRFRRELESSVAKRDLGRLTPLMAPGIRLSFGSAVSDPDFRLHRRSEAGGEGLWQNALWDELEKVMRLGCATARDGAGNEYRAWPAMFITGDRFDGYETWVSLPGAVQRRLPRKGAPIVQRLPPWTVLHEIGDGTMPYIEVRTPKGRRGFVARSELRSLIDYRLVAQRRDGDWRITAFVAGD